MTVNTKVINLILQRDDLVFIQLKDGLKLQILPNIAFLPTCQKYQNAAFVKDQAVLIVWADSPKEVLARAAAIEEQMMWVFSQGMSPYGEEEPDEKKEEQSVNVVELPSDGEGSYGMEEGHREKPRPIHLTQAIMTGLTLILVVAAMGSGWRQMAIETAVDNSYLRWAFLAAVPAQIWLALVSSPGPVRSRMDPNTNVNVTVLHAVRRRLRVPACRTHQSDGLKFEILLRCATSPTR